MIGIIIVAVVIFISGFRIAQEYERAIVFRLGRYQAVKGPGLYWIIPLVERQNTVDLRTVTVSVEQQETITKDSVTAKVSAVLWYKIIDPKKAIIAVENYRAAVYQVALTTLRNIIGQHVLDEVLKARDTINETLRSIVDKATEEWGIKIEMVEMKDVEIPSSMQRVMAMEAEAVREKRARIIKAEAESEASQKLADAAKVIAANPLSLELRRMQMIQEVGADHNTTTIVLLPSDMITLANSLSTYLNKRSDNGITSMSKNIAITLSAIVLVFISTGFVLFGDQVGLATLRRLTPVPQAEYAERYFGYIQTRDMVAAQRDIDPAIAGSALAKNLDHMATLFPKGKPEKIQIVGVESVVRKDGTYYSLSFEYTYPDAWLLANIVFKQHESATLIEGIHLEPIKDSLEHLSRFSFEGKGFKQYAMLCLAVLLLVWDIYVLALCIKTPVLKRKWAWIIFILLGLGDIGFNWQDGTVYWFKNPAGVHFTLMLPVVIFSKWIYQPLFIVYRIPVGAIAFLLKHKKASILKS